MSPPRLLALGMAAVIAAGTLVLLTPAAVAPGQRLGVLDALFTATSAVCVTGLIAVDTPGVFSGFGQSVILLLIQIGGLGYMTLSTIVAILLRRRVSLQERESLHESLNLGSRRDVLQFVMTVFKLTLAFELTGAVILAVRWAFVFDLPTAAWLGLFHSVSAFNNAGFSLFSNSLIDWRGDVVVNATIMGLIVSGGIGYLVLTEVARYRRTRMLSMHARFVIGLSAVLVAGGALAIYLIERGNPRTLGSLTWFDAALAALFQSVTTRTAGFNSLDIGALLPASHFLMLILMFIGGAPGGTAGGVKVSTFGVTVLALWATIRGLREPTVLGRRLSVDLVARAFFISLIAFLILNAFVGALLVMEQPGLLPTLFEATSAFGTVGLSVGVPGDVISVSGTYSEAGRLLICALMFIGRIGPLTIAFALAGRQVVPRVRYPEGRVLIG